MTSPRRAVLLLRVSTGDQHPENQRPELEQLAKARGLHVLEVVEEKATTRKARPELERVLEDARRGRFEVLVVWALDRLGRSMVGNLQIVLELDRQGIEVISVREPWMDTGGPVRSLLLAIFSWVAEQERTRLGERTRAGLERVRARGFRLGRRPAAVDLERARELLHERPRRKVEDIANQLGISRWTLTRVVIPQLQAETATPAESGESRRSA